MTPSRICYKAPHTYEWGNPIEGKTSDFFFTKMTAKDELTTTYKCLVKYIGVLVESGKKSIGGHSNPPPGKTRTNPDKTLGSRFSKLREYIAKTMNSSHICYVILFKHGVCGRYLFIYLLFISQYFNTVTYTT